MTIPLVSNVAFTEVTQSLVDSNSGVLNDIAGTAKSKLPVQYFKLGENITGNLTMSADSAHQKIIGIKFLRFYQLNRLMILNLQNQEKICLLT